MNTRLKRGPLRVLGTGLALPGFPVTTDALLRQVEDRFDISIRRQSRPIAGRLGISTRHFCRDFRELAESPRPGDSNPNLCTRALREALARAALEAESLDYLLAHTSTPHTLLPSNVAWVADELGFDGPHLELRQACCGFANALQVALAFLAEPHARPIAIVGSETGSVFLDPRACQHDHAQLVNLLQMGDGAGAVVLGPAGAGADDAPVLEHLFYGSLGPGRMPGIQLDCGSSSRPATAGVSQFQHDFTAVRESGLALFEAGVAALKNVGVAPNDADWILTHQASAAIPRLLAPLLRVDPGRFVIDCDAVGNLGSASIWVSLHRLRLSGRVSRGQRVMVLGAEASKHLFGGFVYREGGRP
jgi:3-oxoacyl-[acyl-carrier-protein] synthase-3